MALKGPSVAKASIVDRKRSMSGPSPRRPFRADTTMRQCDGLTGSPGKSQKQDLEDQVEVKQLGVSSSYFKVHYSSWPSLAPWASRAQVQGKLGNIWGGYEETELGGRRPALHGLMRPTWAL